MCTLLLLVASLACSIPSIHAEEDVQPLPAPTQPPTKTLTEEDVKCETIGMLAFIIAKFRDNGTPMVKAIEEVTGTVEDIFPDLGHEKATKIITFWAEPIYANPQFTPEQDKSA